MLDPSDRYNKAQTKFGLDNIVDNALEETQDRQASAETFCIIWLSYIALIQLNLTKYKL